MIRSLAGALVLTVFAAQASAQPAGATPDYFKEKFEVQQILDWGSRPVFSPDSKRIAFTVDDEHAGPAYEIDLGTRTVRCLTCQWGVNGHIARVYYLNDGSYLFTASAALEAAETRIGAKPERARGTALYWMPADGASPPQALGTSALGEIALDYDHSPAGSTRIAWGQNDPKYRMMMGNIVNDGKRAWLVNRTILRDQATVDPNSLVTLIETYDFIDDGKSVLFFTVEKDRPYNGMYKLDIATGKATTLQTDAQHNETHSFPNLRYGLEESNRASDPSGPYCGMSGHRSWVFASLLSSKSPEEARVIGEKYGNKPFDLYLLDWETGKRRRLTKTNEEGGEAHQSTPARDGRHVAFSIRPAINAKYAGKTGLFLGTFIGGK